MSLRHNENILYNQLHGTGALTRLFPVDLDLHYLRSLIPLRSRSSTCRLRSLIALIPLMQIEVKHVELPLDQKLLSLLNRDSSSERDREHHSDLFTSCKDPTICVFSLEVPDLA